MAAGSDKPLSVKHLATIVTLLSVITGGITSVVAWVHADVTVPKILNQARLQARIEIDRHAESTHESALTQREFRLWAEQVLKRLDRIEDKRK